MSTQVDPRLQQIPKSLLNDFELRNYFEELERFLHDLWVRTGAGTDNISNASTRELFPWVVGQSDNKDGFSLPSFTSKPVNELFYSSQSTNYTASDDEFINASSNITVTLPQYPKENSNVVVRNADGSRIRIDGNGKNVNGRATIRTVNKNTVIHCRFYPDLNEWVIA